MKEKVRYSTWSKILTTLIIGITIPITIYWYCEGKTTLAVILTIELFLLLVGAMWYAPVKVTVDKNTLRIYRLLNCRIIAIKSIEDIKLCSPTMGATRICGSGGFFGYWGWFKEKDLGKYFAYFGRSSDCFLIRVEYCKQYMIGCEHPEKIVEYIKREKERRQFRENV